MIWKNLRIAALFASPVMSRPFVAFAAHVMLVAGYAFVFEGNMDHSS
jgi:hypothetical protein